MGKSKPEIVVDSSVYKLFLESSTEPSVGLIVGTITESLDFYVAHFAETLEEEKRETSDHFDDEQEEASLYKSSTFDTLPPATLAFHSKQVTRMLPGGLNIIGLYVVDEKETIFSFNTEPRIKNMISCVTKGIVKNSWYDAEFEDAREKIFLHFNPRTQKFTSKLFDCTTFKPKPIDLKSQKLSWSKLECEFDTVAAMHVNKKEAAAPLKKNLQLLMKSFQESLTNAKILINGQFPTKDDIFKESLNGWSSPSFPSELENKVEDLEGEDLGWKDEEEDDNENEDGHSSQPSRSGKARGSGNGGSGGGGDGDEVSSAATRARSPVHILFDKEPGILRSETPVVEATHSYPKANLNSNASPNLSSNGRGNSVEDEFINHLHVQGKIAVVAFVPEGSSTSNVAERLRQDIVRSMASRVEMHCESLIDEESTTEPVHSVLVHHEIPRRVFVHLPTSNTLLVSDYLFPGEGPKDSLLSFKDILSIVVEDEEAVMIDKEIPFTNDLQIRGSVEELLSQADSDIKYAVEGFTTKKLIFGFFLFILVLMFVALVAPQIASIFSSESSSSHQSGSGSAGRRGKEF